MQNRTPHLPSDQLEGLGPRGRGLKATGLGPSVQQAASPPGGLSPLVDTSPRGPWGFLENELRWYGCQDLGEAAHLRLVCLRN